MVAILTNVVIAAHQNIKVILENWCATTTISSTVLINFFKDVDGFQNLKSSTGCVAHEFLVASLPAFSHQMQYYQACDPSLSNINIR
jgi:hypothetical protein